MADANTWANKMLSRASNAGNDWLTGVKNPRRDPKAAALKAVGKYKDRMQKALTAGSWEKGVAATDPAQTMAVIDKVGAAGYTNGIAAREGKIRQAIATLAPKVTDISNRIQGMPQDTDAQRETRMIENLRAMRKLKG
jgi:chorismate mutase